MCSLTPHDPHQPGFHKFTTRCHLAAGLPSDLKAKDATDLQKLTAWVAAPDRCLASIECRVINKGKKNHHCLPTTGGAMWCGHLQIKAAAASLPEGTGRVHAKTARGVPRPAWPGSSVPALTVCRLPPVPSRWEMDRLMALETAAQIKVRTRHLRHDLSETRSVTLRLIPCPPRSRYPSRTVAARMGATSDGSGRGPRSGY
jgi:hypothetical protein